TARDPGAVWTKLQQYWRFYIGALFTIPLLALPLLWKDRRTRTLLWMAAVFPVALLVQVWQTAHYAAPATGLVILLVIIAMRGLRISRWGRVFVRAMPVALAATLLIQIFAGQGAASWRWTSSHGEVRAHVLRDLESRAGRHLVLVRYDRAHDPGDEWVYN